MTKENRQNIYMFTKKNPQKFKRPIKVVFLGSRPISLKALEIISGFIKKKGDDWIELSVLTKSDDNPPKGVSKWWKLGSLRKKVESKNIRLLTSEKQLLSKRFDLITTVFFNDIIPPRIIDKTARGITNLHFGYLPSKGYSIKKGSPHKRDQPFSIGTYRGSNVLSHAILNGEKWQAVTFHLITEKIDLGPVIDYAWNAILDTTTAWDLQLASEEKALSMFEKYFPLLVNSPQIIITTPSGTDKYPYYNRSLLNEIKVLSPKISDAKLNLIARALSFPNTEPPYFLEKDKIGKTLKRYVIYKKSKGIIIMKPQRTKFIQKLSDIL